MTTRPSTAAPILAVLAILLAMLAGYVGGYVWLGESSWFESPGRQRVIVREYKYQWQVAIFLPAAWVEGLLRDADVWLRDERERQRGGVI